MPLKVQIKVFIYILLSLLFFALVYFETGVFGVLICVLISLYYLYKIYPKFDISPDISFKGKHLKVALTFDDGPTKGFTEEILKILKNNSVKATFFVLGKKAQQNTDILHLALAQDCELGAHTMSHIKLHNAPYTKISQEIGQTIELLQKIHSSSKKPFKKIFRAPHGFKNFALKRYLRANSIKLIPWTRGVWDTDAPGSKWIEKMATKKPNDNEIILLHDGLGNNDSVSAAQKIGVLEALPKIIAFYKDKGYTFVNVSEFLKDKEK